MLTEAHSVYMYMSFAGYKRQGSFMVDLASKVVQLQAAFLLERILPKDLVLTICLTGFLISPLSIVLE